MTTPASNRFRLCLCGLLSLLFVGCGEDRLEVFPVTGSVVINGQPAVRAKLSFFGQDEVHQSEIAPFPSATTDDQGNFVVTSYEPGDGAPAGNYKVTVTCRESNDLDPEAREQAPNMVPARYADPEQTPLTVLIKKGLNE
ncbi:MAG: hypothetical protein AAF497_11390, partial [Planctomycetota bacterium]